jgi:hypothetical protein
MEPIVNGLEESNPESADYRRIDANSDEGKAIYRTYGLRGHPAYVILDTSGELVWVGVGELTLEELQSQLKEALPDSNIG